MIGRLLLIFAAVSLLELYLLIKIGGAIGAFYTVLLVILTAFLGVALARLEGLKTLRQMQQSLSSGVVPAEEMVDGVLILSGGVLLIMPGILSDLFALVLLIPYSRMLFKRWLRRRFDRMAASGSIRLFYSGHSNRFQG